MKNKKPPFEITNQIIDYVAEIAELARQWAAFSREADPSPRDPKAVDGLKKAWSTRLMRAFSGVCSGLLGRCPLRRGPEP